MTYSPDRSPSLHRLGVALIGLALTGGAILAFAHATPARADAGEAQAEIAVSRKLLAAGNATAARGHAMKAIRLAPDASDAHLQLAAAQLALGEGLAAEAEADRAVDGGVKRQDVAHLIARAELEQGDMRGVLATLDQVGEGHAIEALRTRGLALMQLGDLAGAQEALDSAVARAPKDAAVWTDLGRFRYVAGDLRGAIAASDRAVKLDPNLVDALVLRGELVRQQFGLVAALGWFETALKHDPWHHDALIEYAATLGDVGRTQDMLGAVRRAMQARPGSPRGLYLQATLAARAGAYDVARTILQRMGDAAIDAMPGAQLLSGSLELQAGNYQRASDRLGALVDGQPMNITARKLYATALLRLDSARNAITVMRPVVLRGDADSYSLELVGRALERIDARGEAGFYLDRAATPLRTDPSSFTPDDAIESLESAAADAPAGDPVAAIPLIRGLLDAGEGDAALARANAVADANPGAPGGDILVGDVLMERGQNDAAAAAYRSAANIRFDQPTLLRLVDALDRAGHDGDATRALALFVAQNPGNVAALRLIAHRQLATGDFAAAIDTLQGLRLRLGDRDAALLAELAFAYAGADQDDRAVGYGEAAYALQPANPAIADAYGWALLQSGDGDGAVQLLRKAVTIAPRHTGLRWHLAQAYVETGHRDLAAPALRALIADPAFDQKPAARMLLAHLA